MKKILSQDGFTLLEALIAMVILTVGILSLFTLQLSAINGNAKANQLTIATSVANDCFERLWHTPYDDALLNDTGGSKSHTDAELQGFTLPPGVTSVVWGVTTWSSSDGIDNDGDGEVDEDDEDRIKLVEMDVNYTVKDVGRIFSVTFYKSELF